MEKQSTSKGFAILSLAGIFTKVLSLLYVPFLVIIIGDEGLGIYQKIYEVFIFIYALTSMGLQVAVAKLVSELIAIGNHSDGIKAFKLARNTMAVIGGVVTILMMILAKPIANLTSNPQITYGIIALAPTIVITTALVSYRGYLQAYNYMNKIAISQIIEEVVNKIISLIFAYILVKFSIELGATGGTIGTAVGAFISLIYIIYLFKHNNLEKIAVKNNAEIKRELSNKTILRKLFKYGFPITLSAGLQNFGALIDMINVNGRLLAIGYTTSEANIAYGLLGKYKTIMYVPLILITSLGVAVLPAIVKSLSLNRRELIKERIIYALKMTLMIAIPAVAGMIILNKEIYIAVLGSEKGSELLLCGAIIVVFMALVQIQNTILQSVNEFYFVIVTLVIGIVVKLITNYYLIGIPEINIMGAVLGGFLSFVIPTILNNHRMKKSLNIKFSLINIGFKPFVASLIMALSLLGVKLCLGNIFSLSSRISMICEMIILVPLGIIIYATSLILIRGITRDELEGLSPRIIKVIPSILRKKLK